MKEVYNDRTKSNAQLFTTQSNFTENINNIRLSSQQYGGIVNPINLRLKQKNRMNILPIKEEPKELNTELYYKPIGIILLIIFVLGFFGFWLSYLLKTNYKNSKHYTIKLIINITVFPPETKLYNKDKFGIYIKNVKEVKSFDSDIKEYEISLKVPIKDLSQMFEGCDSLISVDLSNLNYPSIYNLSKTFKNCTKLQKINLTKLDTSKVKSMEELFKGCTELTDIIDIENIKTPLLDNINGIFADCQNLVYINLSAFQLDAISNRLNIFQNNSNLQFVDLSNIQNINIVEEIFENYTFYENMAIRINDNSTDNHDFKNKFENITFINKNDNFNDTCKKGKEEKCMSCNNTNIEKSNCQECNPGYYLPLNPYFSKTKCKKCNDECSECYGKENNCTKKN